MPPSVSTGDRDAVVRQVRWCAAVQTPMNCHCQLEEHPVGDVEPVKFVVYYLTQMQGLLLTPDFKALLHPHTEMLATGSISL